MNNPSPVPIEELLQHRNWVRCLARELVLDDSQVDDIEQSTWLAALERGPRSAGLLSWLRAVVRNTASKQFRSEVRRCQRQAQVLRKDTAMAAADVVAQAELYQNLVRMVRELKEPYRTTLLLRYFEDLPPREIAKRMDAPVATVRVRIQRGLERLRDQLDTSHGNRDAWRAALLPLAVFDVAPLGSIATNPGAFLMSMPTKVVAVTGATLIFAITTLAWLASPTSSEGAHELYTSTSAGNDAAGSGGGATDIAGSTVPDGARIPVAARPLAPDVLEGAWVRISRNGAGAQQPSNLIAHFVEESGVDHDANGTDGMLKVPGSLSGTAVVLWLTTPDDRGLHRFPWRIYPEGVTALEILPANGLRLRFVTGAARPWAGRRSRGAIGRRGLRSRDAGLGVAG